MSKGTPDSIDVLVGKRIKAARKQRGLSQSDLAAALGVSFQQVQKYEKAINRIAPGRLWRVARHLNAPINWFFPFPDGPNQ